MDDEIKYDGVTPVLQEAAEVIHNMDHLMYAAGLKLRDLLREHFIGRGGRNFWKNIANNTVLLEYDDDSATVAITDDSGPIFSHKVTGGIIKAKNGKYLAIPAIDEAKQAGSPSGGDTPPLEVLFSWKNGKPRAYALAEVAGGGTSYSFKVDKKTGEIKKVKGKTTKSKWVGRVWYWLTPSVDQLPDPDALPDSDYIEERLEEFIEQEVWGMLQTQRP